MSSFIEQDSEVADGGAFVPADGTTNRSAAAVTKVDSCPAFAMVYNPSRYTVIGGAVVPAFSTMPLISGLNGCDTIRDRITGVELRVTSGHARAMLNEKGHTVIPWDAIPDAHQRIHGQLGGPKSYLWCPKGRPDVHLLIYTRAFPGSKEVELDEPRYIEWCRWLVEAGIIPPAPAHVLRKLLAVREKERDKLADQAQTHPSLKPDVERRSRDIAAIRAELEALRGKGGHEDEESREPAHGGSFTPEAEDAEPPPAAPKRRAGKKPAANENPPADGEE